MPDSTPVSGEHSRATPEVQKYRPRACQSCARSKMRCVWPTEPGATPCQRCAKIKAPCTLPEINPRRRRGPSTRVGQLEEKIDGIMSLLNASQQISQNSPGRTQTPPSGLASDQHRNGIQQLLNPIVEPILSARSAEQAPPDSLSAQHVNARLALPSSSGSAPNTPSPSAAPSRTGLEGFEALPPAEYVEIIPGFRMTFDEADRALNLYRSVYAPYFPFVPIPVMLSAYDLYEKKPFLFRTIISITAPQTPATQAEIKLWFREYIAKHVVINNERRLELLQAVLVHLAWGDFHFYLDSQATNLTQLAVALVIDLGLHKFPNDIGMVSYSLVKEAAKVLKLRNFRQHSPDDMRAVLGCFYVTSVSSLLFRRPHGLDFNPYLNHCCDVIQQTQDLDSDKFLVTLVKMQRIMNRVSDIIPQVDAEHVSRCLFYAPLSMAIASIRKELEALMRDQPPEVECNALLWTHYHCTLCRLYEPWIYMRPSPPAMTAGPSSSSDPAESTARTEALWACLNAARDFLAAYCTIPPHNLASTPFLGAHLSFVLVTASRLLMLDGDADWDLPTARRHLDFATSANRLSDFYDEADRVARGLGRRRRFVNADRSVLAMFCTKMRWIAQWYVTKLPRGSPRFSRDPDLTLGNGVPGGGSGGDAGSLRSGSGSGSGAASSSLPTGVTPAAAAVQSQGQSSGQDREQGQGQAMDIDWQEQETVPSELDEGFWQALFDLEGTQMSCGPGWAE